MAVSAHLNAVQIYPFIYRRVWSSCSSSSTSSSSSSRNSRAAAATAAAAAAAAVAAALLWAEDKHVYIGRITTTTNLQGGGSHPITR